MTTDTPSNARTGTVTNAGTIGSARPDPRDRNRPVTSPAASRAPSGSAALDLARTYLDRAQALTGDHDRPVADVGRDAVTLTRLVGIAERNARNDRLAALLWLYRLHEDTGRLDLRQARLIEMGGVTRTDFTEARRHAPAVLPEWPDEATARRDVQRLWAALDVFADAESTARRVRDTLVRRRMDEGARDRDIEHEFGLQRSRVNQLRGDFGIPHPTPTSTGASA